MPGTVNDDSRIGGEQAIGADPAALVEPAGEEIGVIEANRVFIGSRLAGDLAQDHIVAVEAGNHKRWPPLGVAQVGEGEVENYNVTSYKLAQASSSSGVSQSFASDDSAASAGTAFSACASLRECKNASNLSRSCSVTRFNSRTISSFLLIAPSQPS
jgi:hypothetical protein